MNRSKYSQPSQMDERLTVAVAPETKAKIFELASKQGLPASLFIRQAINAAIQQTRAA